MKYFIAFLLFFFLEILDTAAQEKIEDLKYIKLIEYYANTKVDSMEYYAKKLASSSNDCYSKIGEISLANVLYKKGKYDMAEEQLFKLLSQLKGTTSNCQNINRLAILNRLFWIKKNTGHLELAFNLLVDRMNIILHLDQSMPHTQLHILATKLNMAMVKSDLGLYKASNIILRSANAKMASLELKVSDSDKYHLLNQKSSLYNIMGDNYLNIKKLDSAKLWFTRAFNITEQFQPKHKDSKALYQLRLARILILKDQPSQALSMVNNFDSKQINSSLDQDIDFVKALIFHKLEVNDSSKIYCHKFLRYARRTPSTVKNEIVIENLLAEQYHQEQKIDSAYKYSQLATNKLNALNNSKTEASKSHYLYDFTRVSQLNQSIKEEESDIRNKLVLIFSLIVLTALTLVFHFYKIGKKFSNQYNSIINEFEKRFRTKTKSYSINESLEKSVLQGLVEFENSVDYLHHDFSIITLAKKLNTNTSYLSSIINEKKKKSFKQYISELRINYLIAQLSSNSKLKKYTIKALAQEIGYTNASAFSRAFKNHTGKTPSAFIDEIL